MTINDPLPDVLHHVGLLSKAKAIAVAERLAAKGYRLVQSIELPGPTLGYRDQIYADLTPSDKIQEALKPGNL